MNKISLSSLFNKTFNLYKEIIGYGILAMVLYLSIFIFTKLKIEEYFPIKNKILANISELSKKMTEQEFAIFSKHFINILNNDPNFWKNITYSFSLEIILFPIFVGLLNIAHQYSIKSKVEFKDIIIGYQGSNFFKYIIIIILYKLIQFIGAFLILPYIYFSISLILFVPFVLFENQTIYNALVNSIKVINYNWFNIFIFIVILKISNFIGSLLMGIGNLFTYPIMYTGIYIIYVEYKNSYDSIKNIGK